MQPHAGWYDDPSGVFETRWWDGQRWTAEVRTAGLRATSPVNLARPAAERQAAAMTARTDALAHAEPYAVEATTLTAPVLPPPPTSSTPVADVGHLPARRVHRVTNRWLWGLVLLRTATVMTHAVLGLDPSLLVPMVSAALVVDLLLVRLDLRDNHALRAAGTTSMTVWAVLFPPVFLYRRQRTLGRSLVPLHAWVGFLVLHLGLLTVLGTFDTFDTDRVEVRLETEFLQELDVVVTVVCPAPQPARVGHVFTCTAHDGPAELPVQVVVSDPAGDFDWSVDTP